ncbi:NAD(P)-dependent oxidoreductase [Acuticoccus sp.]|uniref:NAD(P)-dependent oxidoreductase n=1 Tax=Acuticoccus sp. TaxID=1904378 RepID=UPI003B51C1AB
MLETVAVVGVGHMGAPMARNVARAGFRLMACDVDAAALATFEGIGAVTRDAGECAKCDAVILLVANGEQVKEVARTVADQVAGTPPVLIIMSTVTAAVVREVADAVAPAGIRVVDAPVSGGIVRAQEGTLAIMAGGADADVAAVRPLLEAMGRTVFACGPLGSGETVKIINNLIGIQNIILCAEAFQLATAQGLSFDRLIPILDASSGRNFFSASPEDAPAAYGAWARSPADFASLVSIIRKDIALAREAADEVGGAFPAIDALTGVLDKLDDETYRTWRSVAGMDERGRDG